MDEIQLLVRESLQTGEFGPLLDWLEERGLIELKNRIESILKTGEVKWTVDVYFSRFDSPEAIQSLEATARHANSVLKSGSHAD